MRRRWTIGVLASLTLVATGCGSADTNVDAFEGVTVVTLPGSFDRLAAGKALHSAYPDATKDALAIALEIADSACILDDYEHTPEGISAVYAVRQTENGTDIISTALKAGCEHPENGDPFITAVAEQPA